MSRLKGQHLQKLAWIFLGSLALLHLLIVLQNHACYRTWAYYYGVYNFAFFDFAHLRCSPVPVLFDGTGSNFMQDHFSLFLPLISPLYWLLRHITGTYTLLVLQWVFIIYGAWTTYRFIRERSGHPWISLAAMFCYLVIYGRFSAYLADFNLAIVGSALVPAFLYYFVKGDRSRLFGIFLLLLFVREDFPLWLIFICLYLAIAHRKEPGQTRLALLLGGLSLLTFIVIFTLIIPSLETDTVKFVLFNYTALGSSPGEALRFMVTHPLESIRLLFVNHLGEPEHDWKKASYYIVYGLSGGVLLWLRPATIICLIPLVAKKMYNDDPIRWGCESYYAIETASMMPALLFDILGRKKSPFRNTSAIIVCLSTAVMSIYMVQTVRPMLPYNKTNFLEKSFYEFDYPARLKDVLKKIPDTAAVCASGRFIPHLALRSRIYYFPMIRGASVVMVSKQGDTWPFSSEECMNKIKDLQESKEWNTLYEEGNFLLLQRKR